MEMVQLNQKMNALFFDSVRKFVIRKPVLFIASNGNTTNPYYMNDRNFVESCRESKDMLVGYEYPDTHRLDHYEMEQMLKKKQEADNLKHKNLKTLHDNMFSTNEQKKPMEGEI